jgi:uncharacterized membrane protein
MARHPRWTRRLLGAADLDAVAEAIARAEAGTSAEIRVHLERRVPRRWPRGMMDPLARARQVFARLEMHRTAERNGVLLYLAVADRRLAVVGDEGIHVRVGPAYWEALRDRMVARLTAQAPREALVEAVEDLGRVLGAHFPRRPDDRNELPDRVSLT